MALLDGELAGVIFDVEGVLLNTNTVHFAAYSALFAPFDVDFTRELFDELAPGASRQDVITRVLGELEEDELERLTQKSSELVTEFLEEHPPEVLPGATELFFWLEAREVPRVVVSSGDCSRALLAAARLEERFTAILEDGDENHAVAIGQMDADPACVLAVVSTLRGARRARAAGLDAWVVAAPERWGEFDDVAEWVFASLADLQFTLEAMLEEPELEIL